MYDNNVRKLKLTEKAIRALILIMLLVHTCYGQDRFSQCFKTICKVKIYENTRGYVCIKNDTKYANKVRTDQKESNKYWGKISVPDGHFYLYDFDTGQFLCWKEGFHTVFPNKYKQIEKTRSWERCRFTDIPSKSRNGSHTNLCSAENKSACMKFDGKRNVWNRNTEKKCEDRRKEIIQSQRLHLRKSAKRAILRHRKRCSIYNDFLIIPVDEDYNCHSDIYNKICKTQLRHMKEVSLFCSQMTQRLHCHRS